LSADPKNDPALSSSSQRRFLCPQQEMPSGRFEIIIAADAVSVFLYYYTTQYLNI